MKEQIVHIPIGEIKLPEKELRKGILKEDFKPIEKSIQDLGLIHPITVKALGNGKFEVISGSLRLRSCINLGLKEVPCIVKDLSEDEAKLLAFDENIKRKDLSDYEKADIIWTWKQKEDASWERCSERFGLSESYLRQLCSIFQLPDESKRIVKERKIPISRLKKEKGLRKKTPQEQEKILQKILDPKPKEVKSPIKSFLEIVKIIFDISYSLENNLKNLKEEEYRQITEALLNLSKRLDELKRKVLTAKISSK